MEAHPARRPTAGLRVTDRDRTLLAFIAEHRIVLATHLGALLSVSHDALQARLRALGRARMLGHEALFERQPRCYWITGRGLGAIDSPLPPPRRDPRSFRHDVGVAWLWIAARDGAFGQVRDIVSERRMRSSDAGGAHSGLVTDSGLAPEVGEEPFAVRLGGVGARGRERLHYPDVLLLGADGRRLALELELTPKSRARRERILAGYAADRRIDAVVYLVEHGGLGRSIETAATRLGISDRVYVRRVRFGEQRPAAAAARSVERTHRAETRSDLARQRSRHPEPGR